MTTVENGLRGIVNLAESSPNSAPTIKLVAESLQNLTQVAEVVVTIGDVARVAPFLLALRAVYEASLGGSPATPRSWRRRRWAIWTEAGGVSMGRRIAALHAFLHDLRYELKAVNSPCLPLLEGQSQPS